MDQFNNVGPNVNVSNNCKTVTIPTLYSHQTCYGDKIIASNSKIVHSWKFNIDRFEGRNMGSIVIGIEEAPGAATNGAYWGGNYTSINYGYESYGEAFSMGKQISHTHDKLTTGSTVEMVLDLKRGRLTYFVDSIKKFQFDDVKQNDNLYYVVAVGLYDLNDGISMLDYKCSGEMNVVNNHDEKANDDVNVDIKALESRINDRFVQYDAKIHSLSTNNEKLMSSNEDLTNQVLQLIALNKEKDKSIRSLQDTTNTLSNKLNEFIESDSKNNDLDALNQVNKLRECMEGLSSQINLLINENKKNNPLYILLHENKLEEYYGVFMENGFKTIESLYDVDKDDLNEMNITILAHKKLISKLINRHKEDLQNEGNSALF
eukprot:275300_1